jgi:hypothetical protein
MKRRLRILRIWYFGRLKLAKKIHIRVLYWRLLQIKKRESPVYYTAEHFNNAMNKAQLSYFDKLFKK